MGCEGSQSCNDQARARQDVQLPRQKLREFN